MDPRGTHGTSALQLPWIRIVFDAAETWCLKAKKIAKLNSTEMDFLATVGSSFQEGQI
jgi:hypothetical protein